MQPKAFSVLPRPFVLTLFTRVPRFIWTGLCCLIVGIEMNPMPGIHPLLFYLYCALKGLLFLTLGTFTPFSFWSFNSLGWGFGVSVLISGIVEGMQWLVAGHRSSYVEFCLKVLLVFVGFIFSIMARHDEEIKLGPIKLILINPHAKGIRA